MTIIINKSLKRYVAKTLATTVFLCLFFSGNAQKASVIDSINYFRSESLKSNNNQLKDSLNTALVECVKSLLRREDFNRIDLLKIDKTLSIKRLSKPYFGLVSWSLLYKNLNGADSVSYHAHVLLREKRYDRLYNLKSRQVDAPLAMQSFNINNWYGAIYYDVVPYKLKNEWHFVFLGWRELDEFRQAKIIESVSLKENEINFGTPKAFLNLVPRGRELLEYPSNVRLNLKYNPEEEIIYFDNLISTGNSVSPSFSFSGYSYDKKLGKWKIKNDIEVNALR